MLCIISIAYAFKKVKYQLYFWQQLSSIAYIPTNRTFPGMLLFIFRIVTKQIYIHYFMWYNSRPFHLSYIHVALANGLNEVYRRQGTYAMEAK